MVEELSLARHSVRVLSPPTHGYLLFEVSMRPFYYRNLILVISDPTFSIPLEYV
jgi:hypothetical protein